MRNFGVAYVLLKRAIFVDSVVPAWETLCQAHFLCLVLLLVANLVHIVLCNSAVLVECELDSRACVVLILVDTGRAYVVVLHIFKRDSLVGKIRGGLVYLDSAICAVKFCLGRVVQVRERCLVFVACRVLVGGC